MTKKSIRKTCYRAGTHTHTPQDILNIRTVPNNNTVRLSSRETHLYGNSVTGTVCSGAIMLMYFGSNLAPSFDSSTVAFRSEGLGSSAGFGISMRSGM